MQTSETNRITLMVITWKNEGRAYSTLDNDDTLFFKEIGISYESVGVTSQTGFDILYYDTNVFSNDHNAVRNIRRY